jgi:AraC-like DNA-binding protein
MERLMSKKIGSICLILMLTKSDFTFANELQVFYFSKSELLHYLLFDAIFIFSVWLFFHLCRIALTHSNKKVSTLAAELHMSESQFYRLCKKQRAKNQ